MSDDPSRSIPGAPDETAATWTFFRQWLKNPRAMAALAPSSRQLARHMVAQLPAGARRVIELGAGTGVFTRALLDHGIAARDLLVVELNRELFRLLQQRFPHTHIVNRDARELAAIISDSGLGDTGTFDAAISGLGFLAMPHSLQKEILEAVFDVLGPDGRLIQFTYGPSSPVPRDLLDELGLGVRRAGIAWKNVPPAVVYVFTRNHSTSVRAVRAGAKS
ncbi:MAG: class I SAM-dependent methyltransferase [Lysobacterales bacterium]